MRLPAFDQDGNGFQFGKVQPPSPPPPPPLQKFYRWEKLLKTKAMFTRGRFQTDQMDPARKSDQIDLRFTWDCFGTGPQPIQNCNYKKAGSILPVRSGPVPDLERSRENRSRPNPVRFGTVPKLSLIMVLFPFENSVAIFLS